MLAPWLKTFVLALALAILPMQGIAQTARVLLCHSESPAAHVAGEHSHAGAHEHAVQTNSADDAQAHEDMAPSIDGHVNHFCCDIVPTGLVAMSKSFTGLEFPHVPPAAEVSRYFTFLKLPQRPPLA